MAGYSIKVGAETSGASKALKKLGKDLDIATKARKIVLDKSGIKSYQTAFKQAGKAAQKSLKSIAASEAQIRKGLEKTSKAVNPTTFLTSSFTKAAQSAGKLIDVTAKLTVAIYGINAAVGVLTRSFGGFFNQTIGRAAKFEATLLKTKTTLASTNDVFVDGKKITDPLKAIDALSGSIDERVRSIRKRTLELAGVTSGEVVEVFGIVASQAGQVNLSLKEAEDLAINFAGALGTFGIPLFQARQEITSILQGNIGPDSYLAKALGIRSEDIQKARTEVGGIAKFLEDRLGTAVAGQAIAAKQLSGVTSNIVEVWEEVGLAVGQVALDPLISGLTFVYETLIDSLEVIKKIGAGLGKIGAGVGAGIASAAGFNAQDGNGTGAGAQQQAKAQFAAIQQSVEAFSVKINSVFDAVAKSLGKLLTEVGKAIAVLSSAFAELGGAVVDLGIEQFKALVGALAQIAPLLTGLVAGASELIKVWAGFLKLPLVQTLVAISTTFKVMQLTGINAFVGIVVKAIIFKVQLLKIITAAKLVFTRIKTGVAIVIQAIGKVLVAISQVIQSLTQVGVKTGVVSKKAAADMNALAIQTQKVGLSAKTAAASFQLMGAGILKAAVAMKAFLVSTVGLLLLQVALSAIVYAVTKVQEGMSKAAENKKLQSSIAYLDKTAQKAADGGLSSLEERLRSIAEGKVNTKIDEIAQKIAELDAQTEAIRNSDPAAGGARGEWLRQIRETQAKALAANKKERIKLEKEIAELEKKLGKDTVKDNAQIQAKEAKKLGKELNDFNRQQQNELFRKRMELARAEVDLFKSAGELRIRQMEVTNRKLIEGEEGASRTALEALNDYLSQKERGELDIAAQRQNLELTMQNRAKTLEDYRYKIQEQINKLREKVGKYEKEVADYRLKQAKKEGNARTNSGGLNGNFGSDAVGRLTAAIVAKESNNNYRAYNPDAGDGTPFSGAIGIGQVMGANVPSWSEKYYGQRLTPEEFSKNNAAQDAVVRGRIKEDFMEQKAGGRSDEAAARRVAAKWYSGNPNLETSTRPQMSGGKSYPSISDYATDVVRRMSSQDAAEPSAPEMPTDTSSGEIEKIDALFGSLGEKTIAIQEAMNDLGNSQALANVAKVLYPDSAKRLEGAEDAKARAQASLGAVGQGGSQAASQIEIEIETRRKRMAEERKQFEEKYAEFAKLSAEDRLRLTEVLAEAQVKANENLDKEKQLRIETNALLEQGEAIRDVDQRIQNLQESNELLQQRNRLEEEGVTGPALDGALKLVQLRQEMNRQLANGVELTEELRQKYADLANEIQKTTAIQVANADPVNRLMKQYKDDIGDTRGQIALLAQSVQSSLATAMSSAVQSVVTGTGSVQEAFSDMFANIGKAFLDMATQMIAKALIMKALNILGSALGGGGTSITGNSLGDFGGGTPFAGAFRASGGPVSSNTPYIVGEEGPELFIPGASGSISNNDQFEAARDALATGNGFTAEEEETVEKLGTTQQPSQLSEILRDSRSAIESISRISKERETAGVNKLVKELGATSGSNGETISTFGSSTTNNFKERLGGDSTVEKIIAAAAQQTAQAEAVSAARDALTQSGDEQNTDSSELKTSRDYIEKVANNLGSAGTNTVNNVSSSSTFGESRSTVDRITAINQTRQMLESVSSVNKERSVERAMENTASGGIKPIDVRYESQVINNVEYVTAEQHRAGVSQAAERGRALALQALQNSVKTRKRVGL